jgi:hypothetical protein
MLAEEHRMIQTAKQIVTVQEDGQIVIRVPGLKAGTRAEVIVREPEPLETPQPRVRRSSLIGSCRGMFKSAEEADKFLDEERSGWDR